MNPYFISEKVDIIRRNIDGYRFILYRENCKNAASMHRIYKNLLVKTFQIINMNKYRNL
ncbi:MAG: hypothetical protein WC363_05050 [Candidatus Izemoplasmatales bacterium]